jgi:nucleoside-diphosphate-sugar epimerase
MTKRGPILVTGAGGFIGSTLATGLAALGHDVIALDRAFDATAEQALGFIPRLSCDLASGVPDLPPCDTIIHAAALTTNPAAMGMTDAQHVAANMAPLLAMIAHADRSRPRAFVFLSSSGVFGEGDGSPDLTDTDLPTATGPYSAAKKAGEALVPGALGAICQTHILRLGYLYGPSEIPRPTRQRVSMLRQWMLDVEQGRPLMVAANDPRRDWTYAPDLALAIARLIDAPGSARPLHLCTPDAVADSALAALIATHHPAARIRRAPAQPTKPPMRPTSHAALEGFRWTPLAQGIAAIAGRAAA